MNNANDIPKYLTFLEDERNGAMIYRALAELEKNPQLAEVYSRLAETEDSHALQWEKRLQDQGVVVAPFKPDWRTRTLIRLARRFGTAAILPTLSSMEQDKTQDYSQEPEIAQMVSQESSHARLLRQIGQTTRGGMEGGLLAQFEGRHRSAGGNALRAAVLGANDGLVSNFSLVMGVAGASLDSTAILLTGLAGLLAGAISMALGEWISVQSSRELYERQIRIEKEEIAASPEEEVEELALIYQARGLEEEPARRLAEQIMSNHETALETLSREELGIDPEELGGSAWEAAITSFVLFAVGAILPVIPYFFMEGLPAIIASAAFSAAGLFLIGAAITLFTGRPVWQSGLRQVVFGLTAAAITYLIGRLIGVNIAG